MKKKADMSELMQKLLWAAVLIMFLLGIGFWLKDALKS